jgi:cytochrome c peroxidase
MNLEDGMRTWLTLAAALVASLLVSLVLLHDSAVWASPQGTPTQSVATDPLACDGEPCDAVARGLRGFFDRQLTGLDGNGRSCADCHVASDEFQLSPATVERRFQRLQLLRRERPDADDPLFRAIDADDFRINGENAADFSHLRQNALVRIVFPLPSSLRLIDPATGQASAESFVDVWRSVPTIRNVALSGPDTGGNPWFRAPNVFGGYQLDARVGTLAEQALGALINHAAVQQPPAPGLLDDLASFERTQFTSHRVSELAGDLRAGITPPTDPDPPLTALEQQGKTVFTRACTQCHGGPNQTTATPPVPRFQDINTECPRPVDPAPVARWAFAPCDPSISRNARTYQITVSSVASTRTSDDPGRALLTGFVGGPAPRDDWNKFDVPQLRGIAKTAPYFHNNSAASLEAVVDHYMQFFRRLEVLTPLGGAPPPPTTTDGLHFDRQPLASEREALLAYLRTL